MFSLVFCAGPGRCDYIALKIFKVLTLGKLSALSNTLVFVFTTDEGRFITCCPHGFYRALPSWQGFAHGGGNPFK